MSIGINNKMLGVNNELVKLTNKSLDDNATVRIITLMTLIYLPASFVAVSTTMALFISPTILTFKQTLFGMNFFNYNSGELVISPRVWIFFLVAVPLTIFTVGSWYWLDYRQRQLNQARIANRRELWDSV